LAGAVGEGQGRHELRHQTIGDRGREVLARPPPLSPVGRRGGGSGSAGSPRNELA
jgi:hypothetical protein